MHMWKLEPKRKENVAYVLQLLEEVMSAATADGKAVPEKAQFDLERRKGARLKRGEEDVARQRGGGVGGLGQEASVRGMTPSAPTARGHAAPSRAGRGRGGAMHRSVEELEEMDKMLLARSAATGDAQLKRMYKRQAVLRKKLAAYRDERREAEEREAAEQQRLKAVMLAEKAKEREVEAARRKRLKEKIAQYKLRIEQERAEKAIKEEKEEQLSKADRRKKIQDHLRKKKEEAASGAPDAAAADPAAASAFPPAPQSKRLAAPKPTGGKGRSPGGRRGGAGGGAGGPGGEGKVGGKGRGGRSQEIDLLRDDYGTAQQPARHMHQHPAPCTLRPAAKSPQS